MGRDGLLIILDEFDVIKDKQGLGSLIKSLSSSEVKFAICGIGQDLTDLVEDHASVERLLEEGAIHVQPMLQEESEEIIHTAEKLFRSEMMFDLGVAKKIAEVSNGYPYFTQLIGKECVSQANKRNTNVVTQDILDLVFGDIKSGRAFPTLEQAYQRAIGSSPGRQLLLHLLADQPEETMSVNDEVGKIWLKDARRDAEDLNIQHIDQLLPRLLESRYGPALRRLPEAQGIYDFVNPVLRLYIRLRHF